MAYLLTHTPILYRRGPFPRKEGRPYLPGRAVREAMISAVVFYLVKKDRALERRIHRDLLQERLNPKEVATGVRQIVARRYRWLEELDLDDPIWLDQGNGQLRWEVIEVFDLRKWEGVASFQAEVFEGTLAFALKTPRYEQLKAAGHAFCEALIRMEKRFLREGPRAFPLVGRFYEPLTDVVKRLEMPLRVGFWTGGHFKGDLLCLWRGKEVREKLLLRIDLRPREVLLLPRTMQTLGWCELRQDLD